MRGHPWRIVAAQAALSALIIVAVYLVLLRPGGDGPLFDVDAPGVHGNGDRQLVRPPDVRERRDVRPRALAAERSREELPAGFGLPGPPSGPIGLPADPHPTDGPALDQYADTLGQIRARLHAAPD